MLYTESEYKAAVNAGRGGAYILCGAEGYLINHYRRLARAPFTGADEYNYITVPYMTAEDAGAIVDASSTVPMMGAAGGKLVEVTVADPSALAARDTDALCEALHEAAGYGDVTVMWCIMPGTLELGTPPKRPSAIYKKLASIDGVALVYFPLSTPAQLRRWIERHFAHAGLAFDVNAADELLTVSGTDMTTLSGEIDKLTAYVRGSGRDRVTAADVRRVCCAVEKYNAFALSNAILDGRRDDAIAAIGDERRRRTEPVVISSGIARVISDLCAVKLMLSRGDGAGEVASRLGMHEYTAKLYVRAANARTQEELEAAMLVCERTDRLLKSSGGGYSVLERLVAEIGR